MTDVLRVGILTPLLQQHSDPRSASDFANSLVKWQVFQAPLAESADGSGTEPVLFKGPLQAESTAGGRQTWSAVLKPGLRFSDGTVLTARHVARSLESSHLFSTEADVAVQGDRLFFHLKRANSRFDWVLSHQTSAIVLEKRGRFLGTGPYVLASTGTEVRLVRNPHHPNPPAIPQVDLKVYPLDESGQPRLLIDAVNRGEVDFTLALSRDDLRSVRGVHKWMGQGDSIAMLYFNCRRPFLAGADIRRAISRVIDRRELAARSYSSPLAFAATGFLPASLGTLPDGLRPSIDQARRLLAEAGGSSKRSPLRMLVVPTARPYMPHPIPTAETLVEQLGHLNLRVEIEQAEDVATYYRRTAEGDYDLALSGWIPDTPDLVTLFEAILSSKGIPDHREGAFSRANLAHWRNEAMDQALDEYRRDASPLKLRRIGEILNQERPLLPLLYGSEIVVHSWRVKNRPKRCHNRPFFAEMTF